MHKICLLHSIIATAFLIGGMGCSSSKSEGEAGGVRRLSGGGATFVDPIMQKWSHVYADANGTEIDYSKSGSSDGIRQMTEKTLDFGCSDAPMKKSQVTEAADKGGEVVHVPLIMGAVAIVYNLPNVPTLKLNGDVIAKIYMGQIKEWNHVEIARLNSGVKLPALPLVPVYRSEGSGTSNIFTEYLSKVNAQFAKDIGATTTPKWPAIGTGQKGSDGVANHVKGNTGCIGYVELSFAKKNSIATAILENAKGAFVSPDAAAVVAAADWAMAQPQDKEPYSLHPLAYSLTNSQAAQAYPICGISYGLLYKKQPAAKGKALVGFLKWTTSEGQKYAESLDYAPLPENLQKKVAERLGQIEFVN